MMFITADLLISTLTKTTSFQISNILQIYKLYCIIAFRYIWPAPSGHPMLLPVLYGFEAAGPTWFSQVGPQLILTTWYCLRRPQTWRKVARKRKWGSARSFLLLWAAAVRGGKGIWWNWEVVYVGGRSVAWRLHWSARIENKSNAFFIAG